MLASVILKTRVFIENRGTPWEDAWKQEYPSWWWKQGHLLKTQVHLAQSLENVSTL